MTSGARRHALQRAAALLLLIMMGRLLPSPWSRAASLLAATWQVYWPLVACEREGVARALKRLYLKDARTELGAAALTLAVTLPPWWCLAFAFGLKAQAPMHLERATSLAMLEMALLAAQEEWFWRGYVQAALGHTARSIIGTSLLFGLCHWAFSGSALMLSTALPSLVFGALAKRRHRLLAATCVHFCDNLVSALLFGFR